MHLGRAQWQARLRAHERRADTLTAGHRERRVAGRAHPVADFLFVYYNHSPGRLRRWHPGPGTVLENATDSSVATQRFHRLDPDGNVALDAAAFVAERGRTVSFVRDLLCATLARPARANCFGLHEWAMVYGSEPEGVRHDRWPLRLGADGTDEVVRSHRIRCSHFDAYRFFTAAATPLNTLHPTRETQRAMEQPGCLHAGMDVYKWCYKLAPAVPGELVLDAFELAADIRTLDMRASPYDLRDLGLTPVRIETRTGKTEFAAAQAGFAERSNALRARLVSVCEDLLAAG
ncbi:3-methyladenine DNA glycosylase [Nostocoides sp. F2B08]|uniref:3-methyladenine DNA glycosylase n=1 Tax=Nostocoides sp. F2B08 TaxID=2653936 RepID=UPI001263AF5F|nr:3-methyladenine DNA glycosylase [Tetrasphaera sp. F2B08]KAB7746084.1 3-methyladenine DNA glycosylase [Tetrasphaera sp. F2B08]